MIRGIESILLFSQNAKQLAIFYKEKVGLKVSSEAVIGEHDEMVYMFEMKSGTSLAIIDHSKVKGKNKQPERYMINFEVDDIEKEFALLMKAGVKKIKDVYHVESYGLIATFEDTDGNYFQLVKIRAS